MFRGFGLGLSCCLYVGLGTYDEVVTAHRTLHKTVGLGEMRGEEVHKAELSAREITQMALLIISETCVSSNKKAVTGQNREGK